MGVHLNSRFKGNGRELCVYEERLRERNSIAKRIKEILTECYHCRKDTVINDYDQD